MLRSGCIAQRLGPMLRIDQLSRPDIRPGADPYETSDSYRPLEHIYSLPPRLCLRLLTCSEFATVLPSSNTYCQKFMIFHNSVQIDEIYLWPCQADLRWAGMQPN